MIPSLSSKLLVIFIASITMSDEGKYQGHLSKLQEILSHLNILREDRAVYIRSEDVLRSYELLCQQVCSADCDAMDNLTICLY